MDAMKTTNSMQLQANSLNRPATLSSQRDMTGDVSSKDSTESEFDQELLQAGLAAQQMVGLKVDQKVDAKSEQKFDQIASQMIDKKLPTGPQSSELSDPSEDSIQMDSREISPFNPSTSVDQAASVLMSSPLPTLASKLPTFSQTAEKAWTGPDQSPQVVGNDQALGASSPIRVASNPLKIENLAKKFGDSFDLTQHRIVPNLGNRSWGEEPKGVQGGYVIAGQELGRTAGQEEMSLQASLKPSAMDLEEIVRQSNELPLGDLLSDSDMISSPEQAGVPRNAELSLSTLASGSSRPVQEGKFRTSLVSGNDFVNTRSALASAHVVPNPLLKAERQDEFDQNRYSQNESRLGVSNSKKPLIKDKPRVMSEKLGLGQQRQELQDLRSNFDSIGSPVLTQKQLVPEILQKERGKLKSNPEGEQPSQFNLDSKVQLPALSQLFTVPDVSAKSGAKQEMTLSVSNGPESQGKLAPEGLNHLGLGIIRSSNQGGGEIRVRLRPDHLGELNIRVLTEGNRVGLKIQASDDRAKKILEESIRSLRDNLSSQNLSLSAVDLSTAKSEAAPEPRQFQASTGFQNDPGQGRNQNGSQSERFYDEPRNSRQDLGSQSSRPVQGLRSSTRAPQATSRLDVMV